MYQPNVSLLQRNTYNNMDQIRSAEPLQTHTHFLSASVKTLVQSGVSQSCKLTVNLWWVTVSQSRSEWMTLGIHLERSPCFPTSFLLQPEGSAVATFKISQSWNEFTWRGQTTHGDINTHSRNTRNSNLFVFGGEFDAILVVLVMRRTNHLTAPAQSSHCSEPLCK